jgi:tetratricopeptide (TPR) repeat protein
MKKNARIAQFTFTLVAWLICATSLIADEQSDEAVIKWRPRIAELAGQYRAVVNQGRFQYEENLHRVLALFEQNLEKEPIKHREKLYGYYAHLQCLAGKYDEALRWADKAEATPYTFWAYAGYGSPQQVRREVAYRRKDEAAGKRQSIKFWDEIKDFPYAQARLRLEANLDKAVVQEAIRQKMIAEKLTSFAKKPKISIKDIYGDINYDKLVEVGDLYLEMGDLQRALHAYKEAYVTRGPNWGLKDALVHPHPIWEKIALVYEKAGDWDQALSTRLSQLCDAHGAPPPILEGLNQRIIELLARIGAEEKAATIKMQHKPDKLERIFKLYLDQHLPLLAERVVELMEKVAGKQLPEFHARLWEDKANTLAYVTADPETPNFKIVLWQEVWTRDKIVLAHKKAIELGKKANWPAERIKKLEEQTTKLPDFLKYVKEPKNVGDVLSGKAEKPKW